MTQILNQLAQAMAEQMEQAMSQLGANMENALSIDPEAFAEAFQMNMTGDELMELLMSMNAIGRCNLRK